MKLFTFSIMLSLSLSTLACKSQDFQQESASTALSDHSSQKCGLLKQDQGKFMLFSKEPAGIEIAPQDGATLNTLTVLNEKEICMIGNFYETPVMLTSTHFIQSKYQTVCGKLSKVNDGYLLSVLQDPMDYELLPQDGASTNILESKIGSGICISADFRDQEVMITSASQILPDKTKK